MPYNQEIEKRINNLVSDWENIANRKMFGGVCHLLNGNMFCGVHKDYLILRIGERSAAEALKKDNTKPFDITGRPMKGWVMVEKDGFKNDRQLEKWLLKARAFVSTLAPKNK